MDVLYIVGTGSKHGNAELRWSLRSIEKHARNLGRVIVAGYPPNWLSDDVVAVRHEDDPSAAYKHVNVLNCILRCCEDGIVNGEFLYSSDDHFLCADVDFDDYPYYYKRNRIRSEADYEAAGKTINPYRLSMAGTRTVLEALGYDPREWSCHANTHMDSNDAGAVTEMEDAARSLGISNGLEPTCCFMAARHRRDPVVPQYRKDLKVRRFVSASDVVSKAGASGAFSIGDRAFDCPGFVEFMESSYPEKSRFER